MTTQLDKLRDLFSKMDSIEGITANGRHFKIDTTGNILKTQIMFNNNEAFEPSVMLSDIINKNILSTINKIDSSFFNSRPFGNFTKTRRKQIELIGSKEGEKFTASLSIENNRPIAILIYNGIANSLSLKTDIPEYISNIQRHDWLYLHYQKKESWIDGIKFHIKEYFYECCGINILGSYNYCYNCGKKQEVNGIVIDSITAKELLTKIS
jgi:hypothetical protein